MNRTQNLTLSRAKLLQKCVQVIDTFDPKRTTVDAYVEDAPILKDKSVGDVELKFIHQVFYGCVRYQKFLKLFVTSFLYKSPAKAVRAEQTLYMILAYLLFFRLEELGVGEMRQMLNCGYGTNTAIFALLEYALDAGELEKWVKVEWCKVYDKRYIEDDIMAKLQSFSEELRPIVEEMEYKATGTVKSTSSSALPTREKRMISPKPFNLTQAKPRPVPELEVLNHEVKAMPIPAATYATTLADVEEQKRQRREEEKAKVAAKYGPQNHFDLKTATRRDGSELEELAKKVDAERMAECTFKPKVSAYVPPSEEAVVRQNVASVLREDALLKQKQAKEYEILKRYEQELHDASEFHRWQEKTKEADERDEERRVHQRMVETQLARENAIEALESEQRKRGIMAAALREEMGVELARKAQEDQKALEGKQQLVKETQEDRDRAREAELKAEKARAERAELVRKEKEAEAERRRLEDEHEMERKRDLIRQIRALERAPVERFKKFDPAEAPTNGLLEEMSHSELWERLEIMKARASKELEDKKERQIENKLEKQREIAEKAETLARIRDRAREESRQRHDAVRQKKQLDEEAQQRLRDAAIEEVAAKIQKKKQQKKEEELRLRRELKEISTKRQFLAANAEMVEAKAHAEQHAGLDREAKERQRKMLMDQRKLNEIQNKDDFNRRANRQASRDEYDAMQEAVNDRLRRAKAADLALKGEIKKANETARNSQKSLETRLRDELGHSSNRYSSFSQALRVPRSA